MPKGNIIAMGGNVKFDPEEPLFIEFYNRSKELVGGRPLIGVIPSASGNPPQAGEKYSEIFRAIGADTEVIHPSDRSKAFDGDLTDITERCDSFFFTGGNQLRLTTLLGGTDILDIIKEKHEDGAILAGTSAGSACLSTTMIAHGTASDALVAGEVELTQGLGFIDDVIIDTHFASRGRFPRLYHAVAENPGLLGIGIGEGTGTIWDFQNNTFQVSGRRNIVIVDGRNIIYNNTSEQEVGGPLCVEGYSVHILCEGCVYDLEDRVFNPPDEFFSPEKTR